MDISNKKSNYHDNKVEIYNGTMLLFGPKLLRNEITQSWRHHSKKKKILFSPLATTSRGSFQRKLTQRIAQKSVSPKREYLSVL